MENAESKPKFNSWKQILDCAMYIGKKLMENGAEIHRVEETIEYICKAYGCYSIDVFAIPNMITATVEDDKDYYTTKIKRIKTSSVNLYNIETLNNLARKICNETPDFETLEKWTWSWHNSQKIKYVYLLYIGAFFGSGGFAMFFGGNIRDGLCAGIAGLIMGLIMFTNHNVINKLVDILITSTVGGLVSALLYKIGLGEHVSYIMIGAIMMVIPGMAIGNAFKDIMMDDLLSGTFRMLQSTATALVIAIGFSIAIVLFKDDIDPLKNTQPYWAQVLEGVIGTLGFGLTFNNNLKHFGILAIGAAIVTIVYLLLDWLGCPLVISCMVAAIAGIFFSEGFARIIKAPAIVFLTTILLPLAPGGMLYYTMFSFWNKSSETSDVKHYLLNTFYISFGMGAGIIIGTVVVKCLIALINIIKNKKTKAIK